MPQDRAPPDCGGARRERCCSDERPFRDGRAGGLADQVGDHRGVGHVDGVAAGVSVTVAPIRCDIVRCATGLIIRSSVATRYQLGLLRQVGSVISPPSASTPHGTCESAMNAACSALTSPANEAWNFSRSRNRKPSTGGRIGGCGPSGGKPYIRDPDGYLIEVGQSTGLLGGRLAKKRPEDLPD